MAANGTNSEWSQYAYSAEAQMIGAFAVAAKQASIHTSLSLKNGAEGGFNTEQLLDDPLMDRSTMRQPILRILWARRAFRTNFIIFNGVLV